MSTLRRAAAPAAVILAVLSIIVFLPGASNRWVLPKDALLAVAALVSLAAVARGRLPRWIVAVMAVAAIVLVVAALGGDAPLAQLLGRAPRYEGAITLSVYAASAFLGARMLGPTATVRHLRLFTACLSVASLLFGAVSLAEALGVDPIPTDVERPGALAGNASHQGVVGIMLFALLMPTVIRGLASKEHSVRWLPLAGAVAAMFTVIASASRAAFIALVVAMVVLAAVELVRLRRERGARGPGVSARRSIAIGVAAVLLLGAGLVAFPFLGARLLGETPLAQTTVSNRVLIYQRAIELVAEHPFGVGPSGFMDAASEGFGADWYAAVGSDPRIDSPHDWLLQAAMAGGIPMLVLAVVLAALTAIVGVRSWLRAGPERSDLLGGAGAALVGFAVALLTDFTAPATTILAGLLIGMLVARTPAPAAAVVGRRARIQAVAVTAWVAGLLVVTLAELPLGAAQRAGAAGDVAAARAGFDLAAAMRPWDPDVTLSAARWMTELTATGETSAAPLAVDYAERTVRMIPTSVAAALALGVAQRDDGAAAASVSTLERLSDRVPEDPRVARELEESRATLTR